VNAALKVNADTGEGLIRNRMYRMFTEGLRAVLLQLCHPFVGVYPLLCRHMWPPLRRSFLSIRH
jgi:hypothetical protein